MLRKQIMRDFKHFLRLLDNYNAFIFSNKDFTFLIKKILKSIFYVDVTFSLTNFLVLNELFKNNKPIAAMTINEYSIQARSAIYTAKKNNIPTIAVQHGILYSSHIGYNQNNNVKEFYKENYKNTPFPDYFMVGGKFFKEILIKNSVYTDKTILPFGYMPYENNYLIQDSFKPVELIKALKIPMNKKIILYADNIMPMDRKLKYIDPIL